MGSCWRPSLWNNKQTKKQNITTDSKFIWKKLYLHSWHAVELVHKLQTEMIHAQAFSLAAAGTSRCFVDD